MRWRIRVHRPGAELFWVRRYTLTGAVEPRPVTTPYASVFRTRRAALDWLAQHWQGVHLPEGWTLTVEKVPAGVRCQRGANRW